MADNTTPATPYAPPFAPEHFGELARYCKLDKLNAYLERRQYKGLPDFWTGQKANGEVVPLRERAPCVVYSLPKNAVDEAVRFTFGEGRFPAITLKEIEAADDVAGLGLTKDDAELLEKTLEAIIDQAGLRGVMRSLLYSALGACTAVASPCIRKGQFCVDQPRAQDCCPVFESEGDPSTPVSGMTWAYPFEKQCKDERTGKPCVMRHYFRRDFTAAEFVVFEDAKIEQGKAPAWTVDAERTVEHGFSFCPVLWLRNLPDPHCGDIDGTSLIEDHLDEFTALNFALSQRHRGITFFGTPQPYETGVEEDDGPKANARTARPGYSNANSKAPFGTVLGPDGRPARASAPDKVWSYRGQNVRVGLIETTGKAFEVATAHVDDISARLKQSMGVVLANVADILSTGDIPAQLLERAYAPLLALVDELREWWWTNGLKPLLSMMLRMLTEKGGQGILIPQSEKVAAILKKRIVTLETGETVWIAPTMTPKWGNYFSPSSADISKRVETAANAKEKKLIPAKEATTYVASDFGIRDVTKALEEIEEHAIDQAANAPEQIQVVAPVAPPGTTPPNGPTTSGPKPPANTNDKETPPSAAE